MHLWEFGSFDECIVSLHARDLGVREIQQHLLEIYKVEVFTAFITNATDAVIEEFKAWQTHTLEPVYPIVYFDAIGVKICHEGKVTHRVIYLALAIYLEGKKEMLAVAIELKNCGLQNISICCFAGLSDFAQALEAVYPKCRVQCCIIHSLRNSLKYLNWKDRKAIAADPRPFAAPPPRKRLRSHWRSSRSSDQVSCWAAEIQSRKSGGRSIGESWSVLTKPTDIFSIGGQSWNQSWGEFLSPKGRQRLPMSL